MDQSNFVYIYENLNHINGSKSFDTSSSLFLPIPLQSYSRFNSFSLLWYWGQVGWSLTATGKGFSGENNFNISNGDKIKGVETNCSNQIPAFPVQSVF